jgi:hypothetical protein
LTPGLAASENVGMVGGDPPPNLPPAPEEPAKASFVASVWPRRRTWIVLGRILGGFGAFIAALVAAAQFAFGGDEPDTPTVPGGSTTPYTYTSRADVTGTVSFEAPTRWGNVNGSTWLAGSFGRVADDTPLGRKLQVAPNIDAWGTRGELQTPGVFVGVSELLAARYSPRELAEVFSYKGCEYASSRPYRTSSLEGWEARSSCPGTETSWVTLAVVSPSEPDALVFVQAKLVGERDEVALARVLETLELG